MRKRRTETRMKARTMVLISLFAMITGILSGCGAKSTGNEADVSKKIRVGVCAGPYGDMFEEAIKPSLESKGYEVTLVEFSDYVQPDTALADNEIDLNMFQHSTYLKNFSTQHSLALTYITEIPTAGMAVFSEQANSIETIEYGATVAIPNDDTNLARALRVLAQTGIITLNPQIDASKATVEDIADNPKNLKFTEVNAEVMTSVLDSVGAAVINGNYAISGGLKLTDALYNEEIAEGYYNVIAIRESDQNAQFVKDVLEVVNSSEFKSVIENPTGQYVAFKRPASY